MVETRGDVLVKNIEGGDGRVIGHDETMLEGGNR